MMYRLIDVASLAIFAFGALTFSALALFYWRERWRGKHREHTALPAFTLVSAFAFLTNLLSETAILRNAGVWLGVALSVLGGLALGLLPPLMLHLVLETCNDKLPISASWRRVLAGFYAAAVVVVLARLLEGTSLGPGWVRLLDRAPAISLTAASVLGLVFLAVFRRHAYSTDGAQSRWIRVLLVLMLACALASLGNTRYVDQLADYLLLAFFAVCLYYRARLIFFDVLMKRGVFLALGLAAMTAAVTAGMWPLLAVRDSASPWLCLFLLCWLAGPFVYEEVARAIDHMWLRRPYSVIEAEREFFRDVQSAASEEELHECASGSLARIFQARVEVRFGCLAGPHTGQPNGSLSAEIKNGAACQGLVWLTPRPNGVPFLSDDWRLLHLLSGTLGMVLENVRFRADRHRQEEREQQLRLLASRAELKALRAQINPHFLFNALSVIAGLTQYQPELASDTIDRLAQVFRYTLRKSEHEWTSLGEEVEFIAAYLRIEQARFGDRLQVEFDIDPAAERILVPAMMIQPLVENAIRHGVSTREDCGTVGLRGILADSRLFVEVFDNGPGFPPSFSLEERGESHGLRNVAERLRGYYGDSATLSWESGGNRTRVILAFPRSAVSCRPAGERV